MVYTYSFNVFILNATCQNQWRAGTSWGKRSRTESSLPYLLGELWGCTSLAPEPAAHRGHGATQRHWWGQRGSALAMVLPLSSDTSVQGWNCQLSLSAGTEVIHCFGVAAFKPTSYLQQSQGTPTFENSIPHVWIVLHPPQFHNLREEEY